MGISLPMKNQFSFFDSHWLEKSYRVCRKGVYKKEKFWTIRQKIKNSSKPESCTLMKTQKKFLNIYKKGKLVEYVLASLKKFLSNNLTLKSNKVISEKDNKQPLPISLHHPSQVCFHHLVETFRWRDLQLSKKDNVH